MKFYRKSNDNLKSKLEKLKDARAAVGWFKDAKYDDNTSVAEVAQTQEFGSQSAGRNGTTIIPPRPFMRSTRENQISNWKAIAAQEVKKCIDSGEPLEGAVGRLGLRVQHDVTKTISELSNPGLKESTIKARQNRKADKKTRGSLDKPLVDTGHMLDTIDVRTEEIG